MIRRSSICAALFIVVTVCVVVLVARQPFDGRSVVSWALVATAVASLLTVQWLSRSPASAEYDVFVAWQNRLVALNAKVDVEDVFIHERLDAAQWEVVYRELESQPKDRRSLKDALGVTFPNLKT